MNGMDQSMEKRLERSVKTATLSAYYGGLLTDKQRTALRLHYEEDWSLGEIADELNVSRQNVHELITRSEEKLSRYEALLGCARRAEEQRQKLSQAVAALHDAQKAPSTGQAQVAVARAQTILTNMISQQEGEDESHGV